jgi:hypothetical protein
MRRSTYLHLALTTAAALLTTSAAFLGCIGDDPIVAPKPDASLDDATISADGAAGKTNGAACAADHDCASGVCVDGVCCNAKCDGVCETCSLPGALGQCTAIADGEDPDNECPTTPLPDAAAPDANAPNDAGDDASDAAAPDAGELTLPDGGLTLDDAKCAGKCNGKRACTYPSSATTCGTTFCNTTADQGRAECDGAGHCLLGLEACQAYACPEGASGCKTTCTSESDCLPTHYCDGTCKPKLGNGTACQSVTQCQSGYCAGNVCCSDACDPSVAPGATCTKPGSVGTCMCTACASGPCKAWHLDHDKDGYGDPAVSKPGCVSGPAPEAGYVEDDTDCDDGNVNVHPGQLSYFAVHRTNGSFDYDCSGTITKETPEFVGGSCRFCSSLKLTCGSSSTCATAGAQASFDCRATRCTKELCIGTTCSAGYASGFKVNVACGETGAQVTCGTCAAADAAATQTTVSKTQRCK